jgi:3-methylcrotonyl-CoA carboxylase alpha subunit
MVYECSFHAGLAHQCIKRCYTFVSYSGLQTKSNRDQLWHNVTMSKLPPFQRILIANRGEIAIRVIHACREMGISPIAIYSEADANALHVQMADQAYCVGPAPARDSYLNQERILEVAKLSQADAIHPGYGFLSENAVFTKACQQAGIVFIGPSPDAMDLMGSKIASKRCMDKAAVPTVPGYYGDDQSEVRLNEEAQKIGFPLLVKASAGGGGKGMRVVKALSELTSALASAKREALNAFGDDAVFLERYFETVRHIEFQILADTHGQVLHLFERECSIQRRHQKIVEEAPSPALDADLRARMAAAAVKAAQAVNYVNAGTIEMLLDENNQFYFLEMNTRLQVEHPVTESILGLDLVKAQIEVAAGLPLPWTQADLEARGHALEVRIYAEDPARQFMPTTGTVLKLKWPQGPGIRIDSGLYPGQEISPYYDPMLAKLIAWGPDREAARTRLLAALKDCVILGLTTNIAYLIAILEHPQFIAGQLNTHFVEHFASDLALPLTLPAEVQAVAARLGQKSLRLPMNQAAGTDLYNPWLRTDLSLS